MDTLYVVDSMQGRGYGSQILQAAERGNGYGSRMLAMLDAFCRNQTLRGIVTGTEDFQAYAFYQTQGFQVISTRDEHPPGHTAYLLAKYL